MKFLNLSVASILRRRLSRNVITIMIVAFTIFFFCVISVFVKALSAPGANSLTLRTWSKYGWSFRLPKNYASKVNSVQGIRSVSAYQFTRGIFHNKNKDSQISMMAVDDQWIDTFQLDISSEQRKAYEVEKNACVLPLAFAKENSLEIGSKINFVDVFGCNLDLVVRGVFDGQIKEVKSSDVVDISFFHYGYLNECIKARYPDEGEKINGMAIAVQDANDATRIQKEIDAMFENSSAQTLTQTNKEFIASWLNMFGNIGFVLSFISGAIFFAMSFIAGSTMFLSVAERLRETGTLMAIGFSKSKIAWIIVQESALLSVFGSLIGLAFFNLFSGKIFEYVEYLPMDKIGSASAQLFSIAASIVFGVVVGVIPALKAVNTEPIKALRSVA